MKRRRAKRAPSSYVSTDPVKRANQRANLKTVPSGVGGRPTTHSAYVKQIAADRLDAKTAAIMDAVALDAPLRERDGSLPAADGVVVRLFADALARLDMIHEYLGRHGWQDEAGNPRPVLDYEARLRREALEYARELGMTPRSRAALGLDVVRAGAAFDLAQHWADEDGSDGD